MNTKTPKTTTIPETAETSAEQSTINKSPTKPLRPLTRKQQIFVKHILDNPKSSATQAASAAYDVKNDNVAAVIAAENLMKPNILLELSKHSATAEYTLVEVMNKSRDMMNSETSRAVDWAVNARQTADSILDRVHGKSTIKLEAQSTSVILNVDLSGEN